MALPGADDPKDPLVAGVLAFCVPGLGHLYAGNVRLAVFFFVAEVTLGLVDWWVILLPVHAFQVFAAAGAAHMSNERRSTALGAGVPPPPPPKAHQALPDEGGDV